MAANLLSAVLQGSKTNITLIESPDIAPIGVGESTVPSILEFLQASQINLKEFAQATSASFKLGIRFDDWHTLGDQYFHPFGRVGQEVNGFDFYQLWLKTLAEGHESRWCDYSPSAIMAENQRFMLRNPQEENWVLRSYAHALHLDASQAAHYLREIAQQRGVNRIEATVDQVFVDEQQCIRSLALSDGTSIESDFFIDCTGFKGVLIEETLKVGYEDWGHYLPCNRAVTVQTENTGDPHPYTVATAREAGWTWKIPLQHRTGNGYVFSSQHCSDAEAINTLLNAVDGDLLTEPRVIPFVTGRRKKIWHNNCLALGLASGFLEPLESTAIHLVYKTLIHFIKHFPGRDLDPTNEQAFNRKINSDYEEIRDFIILHYATTGRDDTDFWRWCQTMPMPDSLQEKLRNFRSRGQIEHSPNQFFSGDSWCSILEGMNIRPAAYHPLMDGFNGANLVNSMKNNAHNIRNTVMKMPQHGEYIQAHCAVKKG